MKKMKATANEKAARVFTISKECPLCGNTTYLRMTAKEEEEWGNYTCYGGRIQDRMPDTDPQKREFIKSGYCPDCQERLFDAKYDRSDFISIQENEHPEDVQNFLAKTASMNAADAIRSEFADLLTPEHKVIFLYELDMEEELYVDEDGKLKERILEEEEL